MTHFTLTVATSADGFISRSIDEPPQVWASPEEQDMFFRDVEAADWAIMGRHTHQAADKPQRRRIIFSTTIRGWQRPTQLWLNPSEAAADDLQAVVSEVHPLKNGLILGGQRVHDWFLAEDAIDRVHLTIEPVHFGTGIPAFHDSHGEAPEEIFVKRGYMQVSREILNAQGTVYLVYRRK